MPASREDGLIRHFPVGMVVVDRRYDIQAINGVARRLLGIYNTAIGDDLIHIAQGIPHRELREAIDRAFRTGGPTSLESFTVAGPLIEERGSTALQMTCYPQRLDDQPGPPQQVLIVVNDVTDALAGGAAGADPGESGADAPAPDPATRLQQQDQVIGRLLGTNRQLLEANQEILGTNEELRTANEGFLLSAEEAQASTEEIETLNEEMQATNEELETLNEELQATVEELNTTNEELHVRSIEAQTAAQVSEEERARLAVILNTMGDALLVLNLDGTTLLANAAYERMFSRPDMLLNARDTNGRRLARRDMPQERALGGEPFDMEFTVEEGAVRRWFEANSQPVSDAEGQLQSAIIVIRDITERSLHRLQEQFLSLASHELRTPLTSLGGYLQALERLLHNGNAGERAQRYTGNALIQVERLNRLVGDLVDVVRLQTGKYTLDRRPLDLAELVERVVEMTRLLTDREISLIGTDGPLRVNGDAGRLEQVLSNLLTNANTHAPGTARIDVRLRRIGEQVAVEVQDYGPGIPAADLPHLFSRFYQAARGDQQAQKGLGLGLFIARELMLAHDGGLDVSSVEGAGSTFTLHLPPVAGEAAG